MRRGWRWDHGSGGNERAWPWLRHPGDEKVVRSQGEKASSLERRWIEAMARHAMLAAQRLPQGNIPGREKSNTAPPLVPSEQYGLWTRNRTTTTPMPCKKCNRALEIERSRPPVQFSLKISHCNQKTSQVMDSHTASGHLRLSSLLGRLRVGLLVGDGLDLEPIQEPISLSASIKSSTLHFAFSEKVSVASFSLPSLMDRVMS